MEITTSQFQEQCLQFIELVHNKNAEILITRDGKPWAKLISAEERQDNFFLGSLTGVGKTVGNLTEPIENEWECH